RRCAIGQIESRGHGGRGGWSPGISRPAVRIAHGDRNRVTLQVDSAAEPLRLGRGLECAGIVTTRGVHVAVSRMKSLEVLVDHLDQLRGDAVLIVIHFFLLSWNSTG